jgi:glycosyltransferase involved in cell wall biosynthesis
MRRNSGDSASETARGRAPSGAPPRLDPRHLDSILDGHVSNDSTAETSRDAGARSVATNGVDLRPGHDAYATREAGLSPVGKIAYLVNQYPKVSHTFIRREIEELERLGIQVERYSIRASAEDVRDAADRREAKKTRVVLDSGLLRVAGATLAHALGHPIRFVKAAWLALRLGLGSERGVLVHAVYVAEACLLRTWLGERGVVHVHAHFGTNPAMVAMLCRELGGPPFSFTVHGPEEFDKQAIIALREKIRRAKFVVAISSYGRSQLYRLASYEHWNKIHVVRCGVDASFLDGPTEHAPSAPRLVCVGRLCEQKGHLVLLQAAAELARQGETFELVLVGDGELRSEIERRIAEDGLSSRVRITGWVDGEAVRREICGARALILASFAEGLPVAIMEALALARPVVSTFVAGIPELVEPGKNGWLVPAGSASDLASAIRAALRESPARIDEMGAEGRARVLVHHDVRETARSLAALLPVAHTSAT